MGFIQDHQIGLQAFAQMHGIVEMVAQDFGGPDDHRGLRVFLAVPGQDADLIGTEDSREFGILGI